jgi:hypothetical protein
MDQKSVALLRSRNEDVESGNMGWRFEMRHTSLVQPLMACSNGKQSCSQPNFAQVE